MDQVGGWRGGILVDEVLRTSLDALALDAHHHFIRHFSRQERISPRPISQNPNLVTPQTHKNGSKVDSPLPIAPGSWRPHKVPSEASPVKPRS